MKQASLAAARGFESKSKATRKRVFLAEMEHVVPETQRVAPIGPHAPARGPMGGRPPFGTQAILRIHLLQQWFGLPGAAMEGALHDMPLHRELAGLESSAEHMQGESTILRFRHLQEEYELSDQIFDTVAQLPSERGLPLKAGTAADATIIAAPSSTKNKAAKRDPGMRPTNQGNQWHSRMKAHIAVDADSGLVHTITTTAANANDVTQAAGPPHGKEEDVFADSGYRGADKRSEVNQRHPDARWSVAMMPSKRREQKDTTGTAVVMAGIVEKLKASVCAEVAHPSRVLKCQFGYHKVRYRGQATHTALLHTPLALTNLWLARKHLLKRARA